MKAECRIEDPCRWQESTAKDGREKAQQDATPKTFGAFLAGPFVLFLGHTVNVNPPCHLFSRQACRSEGGSNRCNWSSWRPNYFQMLYNEQLMAYGQPDPVKASQSESNRFVHFPNSAKGRII